ncbi:hypothetical protein [Haliscomenobacter hydrossis]|uniref:Uncharacterized protein n=1 Tax=Haliscomenobacter hydrossis (strain ATCC 27775 / DSM 1100 / LMG 10767 / O) TaxID=760192 RepID=F4L075_HALH1|nr:hypothetical protein [Haliscomenobacter hydrossis]AEE53748.1 hypothetical protein Halhy_5925 [Haliscomenobacter hydrossis DSM 1100]
MKVLHLKMHVISILIFKKEGGSDYREIFVIASTLDLAKAFIADQFKDDDFDFVGHRQSIQTHVVVLE